MNSENGRILFIDKLRVISILGVILIHTTTRTLERSSYDLVTYSSTLFLNQMARFAVPMFFMISGLVLETNYLKGINFWEFTKKRLLKVVVPYIAWSLFYYYFFYTFNDNSILYTLFTGDASYQLYFIPALCIFYLFFPLIHRYYKYFFYPIFLLPLFTLLIYSLHYDYSIKDLPFVDAIRVAILGFVYFLCGILLAHHKEQMVNFSKKMIIPLMVIFGFLANYIFKEGLMGYYETFNIHSFYSSWRPSVFIYVLVSFTLFLSLFKNMNFNKLSKLSFSVFFLHVVILEIVWKYIGGFVNPSLYFDLIFFVIVAGFSFLTSHLLHKIPHLYKVLA